jgi:hypothetical protein
MRKHPLRLCDLTLPGWTLAAERRLIIAVVILAVVISLRMRESFFFFCRIKSIVLTGAINGPLFGAKGM